MKWSGQTGSNDQFILRPEYTDDDDDDDNDDDETLVCRIKFARTCSASDATDERQQWQTRASAALPNCSLTVFAVIIRFEDKAAWPCLNEAEKVKSKSKVTKKQKNNECNVSRTICRAQYAVCTATRWT